jgi:diadenosine tetraphosphate (Ap4A) HIT family hydrolase
MAMAVLTNRYSVRECNFITSAGAAVTQTMRHLHFHIVPCTEGNDLHLPWSRQICILRQAVTHGHYPPGVQELRPFPFD